MIIYRCIKRFMCTPLGRFLPVGATIARYENVVKLVIDEAPRTDQDLFSVLADGFIYTDGDTVTWFYGIEPAPAGSSDSGFFEKTGQETEDAFGNVGSSISGPQGFQGTVALGPQGLSGNQASDESVVVTSTTYTASDKKYIYVDDDTAGSEVAISLPAVAGVPDTIYWIKKLGATANVVIDGDGSEDIDGSLNATLITKDEAIGVHTTGARIVGSEWHIF